MEYCLYNKFQITNHKYQTMTKIQIFKLFRSLIIGIWDLFVIWCLYFEI
ncbi:hypothetical protein D1AOALGA4SA_1773 [Olavius algarvensis Delta 1 endosymbiont]|nr:hypothetical protein D1AOALGA4SA_1773 [Olavius algarvensis Delta 1 endosymbiont]